MHFPEDVPCKRNRMSRPAALLCSELFRRARTVRPRLAPWTLGCGWLLVAFVLRRGLLAGGLLSGLGSLPAHLEGVSRDLTVCAPCIGVPWKICWSACVLRIAIATSALSSALSSARLASSALSRCGKRRGKSASCKDTLVRRCCWNCWLSVCQMGAVVCPRFRV